MTVVAAVERFCCNRTSVCMCQHDGEKEVETSSQNMDLGFPEEDEHHHDG